MSFLSINLAHLNWIIQRPTGINIASSMGIFRDVIAILYWGFRFYKFRIMAAGAEKKLSEFEKL